MVSTGSTNEGAVNWRAMNIFEVENWILTIVTFALLALSIFAFVNSLLYSAESYVAAGKLTKPAWNLILGLGVVLQVIGINLPLVGLAMLVASLVYLVDVRPALAGLFRRRP